MTPITDNDVEYCKKFATIFRAKINSNAKIETGYTIQNVERSDALHVDTNDGLQCVYTVTNEIQMNDTQ